MKESNEEQSHDKFSHFEHEMNKFTQIIKTV
jgi:hypothetical protein